MLAVDMSHWLQLVLFGFSVGFALDLSFSGLGFSIYRSLKMFEGGES